MAKSPAVAAAEREVTAVPLRVETGPLLVAGQKGAACAVAVASYSRPYISRKLAHG